MDSGNQRKRLPRSLEPVVAGPEGNGVLVLSLVGELEDEPVRLVEGKNGFAQDPDGSRVGPPRLDVRLRSVRGDLVERVEAPVLAA